MKEILAALCLLAASHSAPAMDIYKCPGGVYANTTDTRGPEELVARGCKRLAMTTDPVSDTGAQEIVIKRSPDGHFWIDGEINGRAVMFMVDSGATLVSVSEEFAALADLKGGRPIVVATAGGKRPARVVENVTVSASIFTVPKVKVSVGLSGLQVNEALLGQSFLSRFEVTMDDRQMILRNKKR